MGPSANRRWTTAALLMVMVLASMETTVTSTAMPTIVGALQGLEHYSWVASIYLLASTLTMPLYGRLADTLGRKRVLLFAIFLFAAGSLLASFSTSMVQLIFFRGIQGLGAGGIMPVVLTILGDIFTLKERAKIQGAFSAVWGTAALAGPALGAFLVNTSALAPYMPGLLKGYLGWPTIFWVNLPLALMAAAVLVFKYHDEHHHQVAQDTAANGAAEGTGAWGSLAAMLKSPIILPCLMTSAAMGATVIALDTYVPLYVQGGRGMSATAAAATVTPVMLAWASSGIFAAPLLLRWGFRKLGLAGAALGCVGCTGLLAAAFFNAPLMPITATLFLIGLGFGPASMAMLLAAQDAATYSQRGMVTSGITFARNLGGAAGITVLGGFFNVLTAGKLARANLPFATSDLLDPHKLPGIQAKYPQAITGAQATLSTGLYWVFAAMLGIAVMQLWMSRKLPRGKREAATGRVEALEASVT